MKTTMFETLRHLSSKWGEKLTAVGLSPARIIAILSFMAIFIVIVLSRVSGHREWILLIPLGMFGFSISGLFFPGEDEEKDQKSDPKGGLSSKQKLGFPRLLFFLYSE